MVLTLSMLSATVDARPDFVEEDTEGWGDQGNGTYRNPVLNADFSDPDVIRVGSKYYMVASDFHFLGMQVLESDDMVNWRYVSQIYRRFDEPGWDDNGHYAGGSWAPAIRHHNGLYYVYFCTPDEGLYMSTASDPRGPWAPLHLVKRVAKWEDPCPFWDEDGQAYLGRSKHGAGPIIVHRMSADGKLLLDEVTNDCQANRHQFSFSTDGLHFTTAGEPFPLRSGYWKGIRVGLFCYGKSGRAAFDEFTQKVNQ